MSKLNIENFGKNLKSALEFLGMTQTALAEKTGLTQAGISQIIAGHRTPSLESVIAILNVIPASFERMLQ